MEIDLANLIPYELGLCVAYEFDLLVLLLYALEDDTCRVDWFGM